MEKAMLKQKVSSLTVMINAEIGDIRFRLTQALGLMLPNKVAIILNEDLAPHITAEEDCVRLKATQVSTEEVTLEYESTIDIGDIGTDDLNSLVDAVRTELFGEK